MAVQELEMGGVPLPVSTDQEEAEADDQEREQHKDLAQKEEVKYNHEQNFATFFYGVFPGLPPQVPA